VRLSFLSLLLALGLYAQSNNNPFYSKESIVNSITNTDYLAPNVIASIYGKNLSWEKAAVTDEDRQKGYLPLRPAGTVEVQVAGSPVGLYYVSPEQINFLIPASLRAGTVELRVVRQGAAGPTIKLTLRDSAPSLFSVAQHADGSLVSEEYPAQPGEWLVLYALGLGRTNGRVQDNQIPMLSGFTLENLTIQRFDDLRITLNGEAIDSRRIAYAGLSPGFAGLYQINFQMPDEFPLGAEICITLGGESSPVTLKLPEPAPPVNSDAAAQPAAAAVR
jgi:uncharacterized protein (TIGR03437 family)